MKVVLDIPEALWRELKQEAHETAHPFVPLTFVCLRALREWARGRHSHKDGLPCSYRKVAHK